MVAEKDRCDRDKGIIASHIAKMSEYAGHHLETLKGDLEKADKPTWTEALLERILDVSLLTGGALVGEFVVERFLEHEAKALGEFLKKSFEEAVPAGTKAALAHLGGQPQPDPARFIMSQKDGVTALYQRASDKFVESGQDHVLTKNAASRLKTAFDDAHGVKAAYGHYQASRDAYLTCLAKQTLGTQADGATDVSSQEQHERSGSKGHAPDLTLAKIGIDRGVLIVQVFLHDDVRRSPHVLGSVLNGVNETIRGQYQNVPLSSVSIPRQLICSVRGGTDFTLNIDEAGRATVVAGSGAWLEVRATDGEPSAARMSSSEQQQIGAQLLLGDLELDEIGKGGF